MNELEVLKRKASTILDKPLKIEIDIPNYTWFDKLLKRPKTKVFFVKRASLGTIINFSDRVIDIEQVTQDTLPALINSIPVKGRIMATAIAILLENTEEEPSRNTVNLVRKLSTTECKQMLVELISYGRLEDFTSSIVLIRGTSLLKTEEMIASEQTTGEQSAE